MSTGEQAAAAQADDQAAEATAEVSLLDAGHHAPPSRPSGRGPRS